MSNTYSYGRGFFRYDYDLHGEVDVVDYSGITISVPGRALIALVAEHVRQLRIEQTQRASVDELLDLPEADS